MENFWTPPNSHYPRCVDSRAVAAIIEWRDGKWQVAKRGEEARSEFGPQFPGGSLVFVRAVEEVAGRGRWRAFDYVERASAEAGFGLQIHLDDDTGRRDLSAMRDDALIALVEHQVTGCGFAAHAWGRHAPMIVNEAKHRHWRVLIVGGTGSPRGAWINLHPGDTFNTSAAASLGTPYFSLDVLAARPVFGALEKMLHLPAFAEQAESWMIDTFGNLALALGAPEFKTRT